MACVTGILMASLTIAVVLIEIYNSEFRLMRQHLFLGVIISTLFFTMCNYGFEILNWVFIGIIPTYILLTWLASFITYSSYEDSDNCYECHKPKPSCDCPHKRSNNIQDMPLRCPANPGGMRLDTQCGISRFT